MIKNLIPSIAITLDVTAVDQVSSYNTHIYNDLQVEVDHILQGIFLFMLEFLFIPMYCFTCGLVVKLTAM